VKPVPPRIDGAEVLQIADLATAISAGRTHHLVDEAEVGDFAALAISRYDDEPGVYLFYCDGDWRPVTDTHHETIEDAIRQAEFEFGTVAFSEVQQ
jgi:hypothetical protein